MTERNHSFVAELMKKQAEMKRIAETTGVNTRAAVAEAVRQIRQAASGPDPIRGEGVTKSGEED